MSRRFDAFAEAPRADLKFLTPLMYAILVTPMLILLRSVSATLAVVLSVASKPRERPVCVKSGRAQRGATTTSWRVSRGDTRARLEIARSWRFKQATHEYSGLGA